MMVQVRVGDEGSGRRRLGPYDFSNTAVATNSHHVALTKLGDLSALYSWVSHTAHPHSSAIANTQSLKISLNNPQYA